MYAVYDVPKTSEENKARYREKMAEAYFNKTIEGHSAETNNDNVRDAHYYEYYGNIRSEEA